MPISNIAKIVEWKTERGFGFAIANGKKYFVHKSAFGPITRDPRVNDTIVVTQFLETPKGSRISSGTLEGVPLRPMHEKRDRQSHILGYYARRKLKYALFLAIIGPIILLLIKCTESRPNVSIAADNVVPVETAPEVFHEPFYEDSPFDDDQDEQSSSNFQCDGRTHCGQMNSYEEAVFFLHNCPGVEMDGDSDGIPCERQFGR